MRPLLTYPGPKSPHRFFLNNSHAFRYQGHVGAYLVLGGVDSTGAHLFSVAAHGSTDKLPYMTLGSGSLAAMSVFESSYKENMSVSHQALVTGQRGGRLMRAETRRDRPGGASDPGGCVQRSGFGIERRRLGDHEERDGDIAELRDAREFASSLPTWPTSSFLSRPRLTGSFLPLRSAWPRLTAQNERGVKTRNYKFRRGTTAYTKEAIRSLIVKEEVKDLTGAPAGAGGAGATVGAGKAGPGAPGGGMEVDA